MVLACLAAFISFSAAASAVYIVNDFFDLALDRRHHTKRKRPFASGVLSIPFGLASAATLLTVSVIAAESSSGDALLVLRGDTTALESLAPEEVDDDLLRSAWLSLATLGAAGIALLASIEDTDYASWRRVLAVNLDGTFLGCKHALALLKRGGGSIVNLSSISGIVGGHNLAAYNASKGGVRLLTKSVALHGARLKPPVRCNSVHPAFLEGAMVDDILAQTGRPEVARGQIARDIPLGRLGQPAEVAELCVYLLSDESAFVTGAEFAIDGGLTAR